MSEAVATLVGGTLLVATVGLLSLRWLRPRRSSLDRHGMGLLGLLLVTLVGGSLGACFWWIDLEASFSWDLPPLASRMLAAAGWSFAVPTVMALEQPSRRRVRLVLLLLATYVLPLVAAIMLFHLDRFDFSKLISYGFFIITLGMSVATVWYLLRQPRIIPDAARDGAAASPVVQG